MPYYGQMVGDPRFSFKKAFKIPRHLRKMPIGRALRQAGGQLAPLMSFVPGPIGGAMRMASAAGLVGDPFLGGLIGGIARGASKLLSRPVLKGVMAGAGGALKKIPAPVLGGIMSGVAGAGVGALLGGMGSQDRGGSGRSYRRMNPGNIRALRRSIRRVKSFEKLAKESVRIASTVKMRRRRKR